MRTKLFLSGIAALLLATGTVQAQAQTESKSLPPSDDACFWIFSPNRDNMIGSILLNRCTGETSILRPVQNLDGKFVWRWFLLNHVRQEYEMRGQ
jgi:hypothetical protein